MADKMREERATSRDAVPSIVFSQPMSPSLTEPVTDADLQIANARPGSLTGSVGAAAETRATRGDCRRTTAEGDSLECKGYEYRLACLLALLRVSLLWRRVRLCPN